MKPTGIVRRVDELGRIVLPVELRRALEIAERDTLEIALDGDHIVLRKYQPVCVFCNAAAELLGRFGVRDREIEDAVRYHTTGRTGMSRLEKIIYLADLTEEGRHYPDVAEMRRLADASLDEAMLYALSYTIGKLTRRRRTICRDSWQAYNEYVKICKEEKE